MKRLALSATLIIGLSTTAMADMYDFCEREVEQQMLDESNTNLYKYDAIDAGINLLGALLNDRDMGNAVEREARTQSRSAQRNAERSYRQYRREVDRCVRDMNEDTDARRMNRMERYR